jgi:hypothetical protein
MTPFYGHHWKHCREHKTMYIFFCRYSFDPLWETPIPLRVQAGKGQAMPGQAPIEITAGASSIVPAVPNHHSPFG